MIYGLRPNRFIQYTDRDKSITTTGPFKAVKTGARAGTTTLLGLNPRRVEKWHEGESTPPKAKNGASRGSRACRGW